MHKVVRRFIVKKNNFNKRIKALEKEIEELNTKNTKFEGENSYMYNNYEERVGEMSKTTLESNYVRDLQ